MSKRTRYAYVVMRCEFDRPTTLHEVLAVFTGKEHADKYCGDWNRLYGGTYLAAWIKKTLL